MPQHILYCNFMALIKFYGQECGFCHQMEPMDERLEKELGVKLERLEAWHNEETKVVLCGGSILPQ